MYRQELGVPGGRHPNRPLDFGYTCTADGSALAAIEGALVLSTIDVGYTTITITNLAPSGTPFCAKTVPPACPDRFTGFAFTFSSGVDITGVTVDPTSAADFRPNTSAPHDGL